MNNFTATRIGRFFNGRASNSIANANGYNSRRGSKRELVCESYEYKSRHHTASCICPAVYINYYFVLHHDVKSDILTSIAVMAFFGFTFAQIGKSIPIVRSIGGPAILATFIPSAVVYYHLLPNDIVKPTTEFTENSNFLYLFIAGIVVGSILGMKRETLVKAFMKIFIPLIAGSVAAAIVGLAVGTLLGLGFQHTLLYVVIPIMAGGVGEGAIPLSIGYSDIMPMSQGEAFALVLPSIMLGSLCAIILAGLLNRIGKKTGMDRQR